MKRKRFLMLFSNFNQININFFYKEIDTSIIFFLYKIALKTTTVHCQYSEH